MAMGEIDAICFASDRLPGEAIEIHPDAGHAGEKFPTIMSRRHQTVPVEATGDVILGPHRGLSSFLARQIRERAHRFQSTATIDNLHGKIADSRNLLELLLLGVREGDRVTLRCVGPDAHRAFEALADLLEAEGGRS